MNSLDTIRASRKMTELRPENRTPHNANCCLEVRNDRGLGLHNDTAVVGTLCARAHELSSVRKRVAETARVVFIGVFAVIGHVWPEDVRLERLGIHTCPTVPISARTIATCAGAMPTAPYRVVAQNTDRHADERQARWGVGHQQHLNLTTYV